MKLFFIILLGLLSFTGHSKEVKLLKLENIKDKTMKGDISLITNRQNEARALLITDNKGGENMVIKMKDISRPKGALVLEKGRHKLGFLKSDGLEPGSGGDLELSYVKTIRDKTKLGFVQLSLEYNGRTWKVFHAGEQVKKLVIKPGFFGVAEITPVTR